MYVDACAHVAPSIVVMTSGHGTRASYQYDGCRCVDCRASEATYRRALRALHRQGTRPLGTVVSPVEARRRVRQLQAEHVTAPQIAAQLGLKHHSPRLHPDGITLRKLITIRLLQRRILRDGLPS